MDKARMKKPASKGRKLRNFMAVSLRAVGGGKCKPIAAARGAAEK
jgi:hypothetical protein